jgi:hypothetical protein
VTSNNSTSRPNNEASLQAATTSIATTPVAASVINTNAGYIQRVIAAAAGTTSGTITVAITINGSGTDVANGTLTIPAGTGARAGTVIELPVAVSTAAVFVQEGDVITFTPSGGTGSSIAGAFGAVVRYLG